MNLRRCANIQGSRVPYLKSQVSVSLDEVINIKVHVTCYVNNMGFFAVILRKLTNMNINNKKAGVHRPEHNKFPIQNLHGLFATHCQKHLFASIYYKCSAYFVYLIHF